MLTFHMKDGTVTFRNMNCDICYQFCCKLVQLETNISHVYKPFQNVLQTFDCVFDIKKNSFRGISFQETSFLLHSSLISCSDYLLANTRERFQIISIESTRKSFVKWKRTLLSHLQEAVQKISKKKFEWNCNKKWSLILLFLNIHRHRHMHKNMMCCKT